MPSNHLKNATTFLLNPLTKDPPRYLWTETGISTNAYDNLTTPNSTDRLTTILPMISKNGYRSTLNACFMTKSLTTTKLFLIQSYPKPRRFYILRKIHNTGNPGCPIVSSNSHPTERISQFVDLYLKPLVQTTQSFIKDTSHSLNKLEHLGQLPENAFLVTLLTCHLSTPTSLITRV